MKNLHLIPTDKPSRLYKSKITQDVFISDNMFQHGDATYNVNIYITNDEEIKEGDWFINVHVNSNYIDKRAPKSSHRYAMNSNAIFSNPKKIILTTDPDLIKDSVQAINNDFLEWFVKNPSCEYVEVATDAYTMQEIFELKLQNGVFKYKIIIPKEEPKQIKCYCGHTITCDCSPLEEPKQSIIKTEEDAKIFIEALENTPEPNEKLKKAFKNFHKQERMYSEEDLRNAYRWGTTVNHGTKEHFNEWFEQFKKKV